MSIWYADFCVNRWYLTIPESHHDIVYPVIAVYSHWANVVPATLPIDIIWVTVDGVDDIQ